MSLQLSSVLILSSTFFGSVLAANGGLEDTNNQGNANANDTAKETEKDTAKDTATENNTATDTQATQATQATQDTANTDTATEPTVWWTPESAATTTATTDAKSEGTTSEETTGSAKFNKWGFTGDQSVWKDTTLVSSTSGSTSSSIASIQSKNKTSDANRLASVTERTVSWRKVALVGGLLAGVLVL